MGIVEWATSPWGQDVPIHISFLLIWVAAIAGLLFLIVHAIWARYFARKEEFAGATPPQVAARIPAEVPRHSLAARMFHWIMAAAMFALLITAFLPRIGVQFAWVTYHWIAGIVLTASILFHIVHATFWMDRWSIWPDKADIEDATRRFKRAIGQAAPPPRRFAKYPLENKMYHGVIVLAGLSAVLTGVFMMFRVRTGFLPRNPYLFGDMTWGLMYVLHGLAGVGLIALIMVHVYFAIRPEKLVITKSMIFGTLAREHYLEHHDPQRWAVEGSQSARASSAD
ncbi:MAG TPA: cytochrome b/b6 domain-containing protein [Bryobacteraceae bacterium]|nr:cytochrome b/b6 domain-containing protein [Bryobacteraceae bacterium]